MSKRTEKEKMLAGELYYAFVDELAAERASCAGACQSFNKTTHTTPRLERANLFRAILHQPPLPPTTPSSTLCQEPWIEPPFTADYGYNTTISPDVFINFGCTILDTCRVTIGARTLLGPNVSLFAAAHPLNAKTRDGLRGPEYGAPITIEEDCWLAGNVTVLPGVRIGRGSTVGAGSVVTKDVPPGCAVAGNPARVVRVIEEDAVEVFPRGGGRKVLEIPKPGTATTGEGDLKVLMRRLERLEAEVGEVKDELKMRMS
ncbi:unnamed protein product, partial [Tuber aestivum]